MHFNDKIMVADVAAAEAELKSSIEKIRSTLIDGERIVDTARQHGNSPSHVVAWASIPWLCHHAAIDPRSSCV